MMNEIRYKNQNQTLAFRMKRWMGISILFALIASLMILCNVTAISYWIIFAILYLILVAFNQVETLTIDEHKLMLERKSMFSFLSSKSEVELSQIEYLNFKSDQSSNERGWYLFERRNKNRLELITKDGVVLMINGKLHPDGANGIKTLIDAALQNKNPDQNPGIG